MRHIGLFPEAACKLFFLFFFIITIVCLYVCVVIAGKGEEVYMYHNTCVDVRRKNGRSFISFSILIWVPWIKIGSPALSSMHFYPMSNFSRPVIFLIAATKRPDRNNLRTEGFLLVHSVRMQSIMMRKLWS